MFSLDAAYPRPLFVGMTEGHLIRQKAEYFYLGSNTQSDNKVRELIAGKVLHTSLLNMAVFAFEVLPLGSYALMPAPSTPFKTNGFVEWPSELPSYYS
jgi:hypothetical protein